MKPLANIDLLKESLTNTKKAILLLGSTANFDMVAGALGLSLALKARDIDVQVVCSTDMRVEFSRLVGVDQVKKKIGNRNLIVSFDYYEDQAEKVSYQLSDDRKRFNLIIAPKSGAKPMDPESVEFELAGADADFVVLFGINSFEELGETYTRERALFDSAMTLGITLFPIQPFVKCHLDATGGSSLCELLVTLCDRLDLPLDEDSGSNLLAGIDTSTQGFRSPLTTPETFETVAALMRQGAVRQAPVSSGTMNASHMPYMPGPSYGGSRPGFGGPPPVQASNNQFAELLGGTRSAPAPVMPPIPSEFKG